MTNAARKCCCHGQLLILVMIGHLSVTFIVALNISRNIIWKVKNGLPTHMHQKANPGPEKGNSFGVTLD